MISTLKTETLTATSSQKKQWSFLPIILLVSLLLRVYQLGTESVWIDEHFSIVDARNLDLGTRPLYYLLLHGWMQVGQNDSWLRALSIPFGLGCVLLTYLLGRRLLSQSAGIVAAIMVALSPLFVGYSQQIRMYSLSTCLGLWGTLLLVKLLQTQKGIRLTNVIGWLVARLLAVMTTPLNVMLLLPDAVLVLWRFRRDRRVIVSFVIALALVGVIWLPFARALQEALPQFLGGWVAHQPKPGPIRMAALLTGLIAFWPTSDLSSLRDIPLNISTWGHKDIEFVFYMLFTIVLVSVLSVGMWKMVTASRQFVRPERWWLMMWAFLPTIVIAGVSWMSGSIWRERYLMFVAPYAILLIAAGICYLWRHYRRGAIALAILYGIAIGGGLGHYYTTLYHDDWRGIAALIESREQPSDVIGFYGWEWEDPQLTVPRYYEGEAPFYVMSKQSIPPLPQESEAADRFIQDMLQNLPPTESQYWLVYYEPSSLKRQRLREAIEQRFEVKDRQEFYNSVNAELHVYQVAPIR